jgi:methionine-rich copper-binding protein CopC
MNAKQIIIIADDFTSNSVDYYKNLYGNISFFDYSNLQKERHWDFNGDGTIDLYQPLTTPDYGFRNVSYDSKAEWLASVDNDYYTNWALDFHPTYGWGYYKESYTNYGAESSSDSVLQHGDTVLKSFYDQLDQPSSVQLVLIDLDAGASTQFLNFFSPKISIWNGLSTSVLEESIESFIKVYATPSNIYIPTVFSFSSTTQISSNQINLLSTLASYGVLAVQSAANVGKGTFFDWGKFYDQVITVGAWNVNRTGQLLVADQSAFDTVDVLANGSVTNLANNSDFGTSYATPRVAAEISNVLRSFVSAFDWSGSPKINIGNATGIGYSDYVNWMIGKISNDVYLKIDNSWLPTPFKVLADDIRSTALPSTFNTSIGLPYLLTDASLIAPDATAPAASTFSPADEATAVAIGANVVVTFSEAIQRGTGNIVLKKADGTTVATYAQSSTEVTVSGSTLTINPASDLSFTTGYKVEFAVGSVQDLAGNNYAGTTSYNFTTGTAPDTTAPTASTFSPADEATAVAIGANVVVTFSEAIQRGAGNIVLKKADGTTVATYAQSSTEVTVSGSTLTINPASNLSYSTGYKVEFAAGSAQDLAGNNYAGTTSYNFTTGAALDTTVNVAVSPAGVAEIGSSNLVYTLTRTGDTSNKLTVEVSLSGTATAADYASNIALASGSKPAKGWTKLLGTNGTDAATALTTGLDGSIYVSGMTQGALDGQTNSGGGDAFLTRYSADGTKAWTKLLGTGLNGASVLTSGLDGSIYVSGNTDGALDGQTNSGGRDAFLIKYSADGTKAWTRLLGTSGKETAFALNTGLDGSIYVGGETWGALDGQTYNGTGDAFLTKYSADGTKAWTRLLGTNVTDVATALTTGLDGSIYVSGMTQGALDGQTSSGGSDAFVTRYSADGTKAWTKLIGSSGYDLANALTTGLDGSIYVSGETQGALDGQTYNGTHDAFLTKYSADGTKAWTKLFGTSYGAAIALTTGLDGSIYVSGYTEGALDGQTNSGGRDAFLIKYSADGTKAWTRLLGTSSSDWTSALTTGLDGSIYVSGATGGALDGQPHNGGDRDAFLTKFFVTSQITFAAGEATASLVVAPTTDSIAEGNETVTVTLLANTGYVLGSSDVATGTIDDTAPAVSTFSPADEATAVAIGANVVVTFSEPIQRGAGNIVLKKADGTTVATYAQSSTEVTVSGSTLTINPASDLSFSTGYKVEFAAGSVQDLAGNSYAGTTSYNFTTGAAPDTAPPTASTFSPADEVTAVAIGANVVVTFSEAIQRGTGNIVLKKADGTTVATYAQASTEVTVSGSTLTINPAGDLSYATGYKVEFAAGSVQDLAGNSYAGTTSYNFTTGAAPDTTAPTITTFSPADEATGVGVASNITLTFSEPVVARSGGTIELMTDYGFGHQSVEVFSVSDATRVTINGNVVTIDPTSALLHSTGYHLGFNNALTDNAGNPFSYTHGQYNFTTVAAPDTTPPTASTFSPADEATAVAIGANVVVTFSEAIQRGTGSIVLKKTDGTTVATYAQSSTEVSVSSSTLTINPASDLDYSSAYKLEFAAGSVQDMAGNSFAGTTSYNFTTGPAPDTTAPTASVFSPADEATAVAIGANVVATFSEAIQRGAGNIVLKKADGTTIATYAQSSTEVTVSGSTLTINPAIDLDHATGYKLEFAAGSVQDLAGNNYVGTTSYNFTTGAAPDTTAPTASTFSPADEATAVAIGANVVVTFSEAIQRGAGNIVLKKADGTTVATYAQSSSEVTVSGSTLTINPASDLSYSTGYTVEFSAGSVQDLAGNSYAGTTSYNFTTGTAPDTTAPTASTFSPADEATAVAIGANVVVTFSEAIQRGAGSIVLKKADGTTVATYAQSSTEVTVSGSTLTINPASDLSYSTGYTVEFASGSVQDLAGNNYAGTTSYNFTTGAAPDTTAPTITTFSPADGATGVGVASNIILTFSEPVVARSGGTIELMTDYGFGHQSVEVFSVSDATRVTINGNVLTIDPTSALLHSTGYHLGFNNALADNAGNAFSYTHGQYNFTTGAAPDTTAPTASAFSPVDDATSVAIGANVVVTFSEAIQRGAGNIVLKKADGTTIATYAQSSTEVTVSGSTLTINPANDLDHATGYKLEFAAGSVQDLAGNNYVGTTSYNFTTGAAPDTTAPTASTFSPADEATAVGIGANVVVTFSEAIQRGAGNIVLKKADGTTVATYAQSSTEVTVSGSTLTINPAIDLDHATGYKVEFAAGSVQDLAGNNYVGATSYNFTTAATQGGGGQANALGKFWKDASKTPSETNKAGAVNLTDAISILKMIVGLSVNANAAPLSPYQAIAADFDQNGSIDLTDAIGVLKMVVGLNAPAPTWKYFDDAKLASAYNATQSLNHKAWSAGAAMDVSSTADSTVKLVGVLTGDVDGSWAS